MCDISLQSIWISNETLPLVFLLSDAIPGKTLFLVFDIVFLKSLDIGWNTLFSVFGYKKRLQDNTLDLPGERKNVVYVGK